MNYEIIKLLFNNNSNNNNNKGMKNKDEKSLIKFIKYIINI